MNLHTTKRLLAVAAIAGALLVYGCGGTSSSSPVPSSPSPAVSAPPSPMASGSPTTSSSSQPTPDPTGEGDIGIPPDTIAITVTPDLRVRSLPEVSDDSVKYRPLLDEGDALYVTGGPVEGSGFAWYEVYAPRTGLAGWVAAAAKTGEPWIESYDVDCTLGATNDPVVDQAGYGLMHLACFRHEVFSDERILSFPEDDGLRCPDVVEWWYEPDWLQFPLWCSYDFEALAADTGHYDLFADGVVHPTIADVPGRLLEEASAGRVRVEVVGRLDHPDSRGCTVVGANGPPPIAARLECRRVFVITEMRPAG